ncbi:MAG: S-adenosylmethionine:tRNA ribosyltransferase-isomerase [Bacteroidales bacterium]|nr:MAG: S-adenosylmethionine:tRNA ribosyltransferase-isomerase [Bacteroidales bacterium]
MTNRQFENILISDFDYPLPDDRIAKHPLDERDKSKLLLYRDSSIAQDIFNNISDYLPENSLILFNNTKVVQARLLFKRATGAQIEIFLLEPISPSDYGLSFSSNTNVLWKCIVGNLKKWKEEELQMPIPATLATLYAKRINNLSEGVEIELSWDDTSLSFARIVELCGNIPIPPYLNRDAESEDKERYQTIYAKPEGSVAAPTAGLHFTDKVFKSLKDKNIDIEYVTLHVGAGTFKPVKADISEHEMHNEHFIVKKSTIEKLLNHKGTRVVVGTTSLRTLESIYWLGVKAIESKLIEQLVVSQWEPYELSQNISIDDSLKALEAFMINRNIEYLSASTQILIVPGYKIRMADALITNYHQPKSTLLLLVAAFIGDDWKKVYNYALTHDFRFLSYGDSSLLMKNE